MKTAELQQETNQGGGFGIHCSAVVCLLQKTSQFCSMRFLKVYTAASLSKKIEQKLRL